MKGLKNSLWIRFFIIVILQSVLTLLTVYFISVADSRENVLWDIDNIQDTIRKELQGNRNWETFQNKIDFFNSDEENNYCYWVISNGTVLTKFGDCKIPATLPDTGITEKSLNYKSINFLSVLKWEEYTIGVSAEITLDLIDDTLWGYALCLPFILLPVFYFSYTISRQILSPVERVSKVLTFINTGALDKRIDNKNVKHREISHLIKQLNISFSKLESAFQFSKGFNSNAAHELKTPLAAMKGEIEVCLQKNERTDEEYQKCLGKIHDELFHLTSTIETILLISSNVNIKGNLIFTKSEVNKLIFSNIEILQVILEPKNIKLEIEIENISVYCEPHLLKRAFANLMDNASKYSKDGSVIKISLVEKGSDINFIIKDSAEKIPTEMYHSIFLPFFRLKSEQTGSGIGLSLVKWVAELHSGKVEVEENPHGNTFIFSFPKDNNHRKKT